MLDFIITVAAIGGLVFVIFLVAYANAIKSINKTK